MISLRARRFLFAGFFLTFAATAPVLVLTSAGYTFDWKHRTYQRTGLLSVSSVPKGARVLVDAIPQKERTPALMEGLTPGEHEVRLEKDGYQPWTKRLGIFESLTTFARNVVLFPADTQPEETVTSPLQIPTPDPTGQRVVAAVPQPGWDEIWLYHLSDRRKDTLLLRLPTATPPFQRRIEWSAAGGWLLIKGSQDPMDWTITSADGSQRLDGKSLLADVQKKGTPPSLLDVSFDPYEEGRLWLQTNLGTFLFPSPNLDPRLILAEPAVCTERNGTIYGVRRTEGRAILFSRTADGSEHSVAVLPDGPYRFEKAPDPYLLLHDEKSGDLALLSSRIEDVWQPVLLYTNVRTAAWDPDRSRLLYATEFELHVFAPDRRVDELVTRLSRPLVWAAWHPLGKDVFYADDRGISAIELDRRSGRNLFPLVSPPHPSLFWINPNGKNLWAAAESEKGTGLFSLKLRLE